MNPYLARKKLMLLAHALVAMIFLTVAFFFRKAERTFAGES